MVQLPFVQKILPPTAEGLCFEKRGGVLGWDLVDGVVVVVYGCSWE